MKSKYMIGIGIIVAFLVLAGVNFQKSLTPYVSIQEARAETRTVQVKGARVDGSAMYDPASKTFNFKIVDSEGVECQIVYDGVKPSNFDEAKEIVAKGRFKDDVFHAKELLVKCPSKYEAETVKGVKS